MRPWRQIRQAAPESVHQDLLSDLGDMRSTRAHLIVRAEYDTGRFEFMVAEDLYYDPVAASSTTSRS